jgi:hypothetical protein
VSTPTPRKAPEKLPCTTDGCKGTYQATNRFTKLCTRCRDAMARGQSPTLRRCAVVRATRNTPAVLEAQ